MAVKTECLPECAARSGEISDRAFQLDDNAHIYDRRRRRVTRNCREDFDLKGSNG